MIPSTNPSGDSRRAEAPLEGKGLRRRVLGAILVGSAYYAAARLGLLLQLPGTNASAVWPPSGIALAGMLLAGTGVWPGVLVGAFLANLLTLPLTSAGVLAATAIAVGNTAEQLVAVALIRWRSPTLDPLGRARDALWFVGVAGVSSLISATNGATTLRFLGILGPELYGSAWLTWWVGDTAGMLILAPALYTWARNPRAELSGARLVEITAIVVVTVAVGELVFGGWVQLSAVASRPYLLIPMLLWAAFRFGPREASSLAVLVSTVAISYTWRAMHLVSTGQAVATRALGPFVDPATSPNDWLLSLQLFICTTAVIAIVLASAVAERNRSALALIESEKRFRTIFEHAAVGVALVETTTGRFRRINQRFCDIVGRTAEEMAGMTLQSITHPDDLPDDLDGMSRLLAGETAQFSGEKRYCRKDGSIVWVNATVSAAWEVGGRPEYHIAVIEDVTARKQLDTELRDMNRTLEARVRERTSELEALNRELQETMQRREAMAKSLAQSEERLKLTLDNAQHGLWDWDVRSGEVVLDANWLAILGYGPGELPSRVETWSEGIHPDDRARVVEVLESSLRSDAVLYDVDYRARCKDGTWKWINTRGRVQTRDADGNALRMMGTIHDITARKHAQQAFEEQERRYRRIVDAASDIIYRTDANGVVSFANDAAGPVFGTPVEELLGQHYLTLIREDAREAARAFYERQVRERIATTYYEFPVASRQNTEVWLGQNVELLIEHDRVVGFQGVARDITDRRRMERELQQARDQAVDSARLKSEFLANMSHEIRTPMNGVIGLADLLADTPLTREQARHVDGIRASGESLLAIINDILDFSKVEAGMLTVEEIDFDLRATLRNTLQLFEEPARRKRLDLTVSIEEDVPSAVRGDPARLRQILTNLIGNAVKFTDQGRVAVRVSTDVDSGSEVVVRCEVSDTGVGIAPDAVKQLFQPFVQADVAITRRFGGTGLGLAISRRLVELMGGTIGVESRLGEGSTFWFTLALEKREALPAAGARAVDLRGRRVLVVDDNATNRIVLTQLLSSLGLVSTEAEDAAHAVGVMQAAAREGKSFDVVILDLGLPGMNGLELARTIRADPALQSARLILAPSSGGRGDGREARASGVDAYLPKPVRQAELKACLTQLLSDTISTEHTTNSAGFVTRHSLAESRSRSGPASVLVADDNALNREVTRGHLERLGYRVDAVANGEEAVRAIEQTSYAAVLMDCQMPVMDGFAATSEIRHREGATRHTPIIALTAYAMEGERERCLQAGMDDYLAKPVRRHELARVLQQWISGTSERPAASVASSSAAATASAIPDAIDMRTMEEVRQEVGDEELASFIEILLAGLSRLIDRLNGRPEGDSLPAIGREAHTLLGSCRALGFHRVAVVCEKIERSVREGTGPDWGAYAAQLDAEREVVLWWRESRRRDSVGH